MKITRGQVAVVTGAASGLGRGLARAFAAEGLSVVLADLDGGKAEQASKEVATDFAVATLAVGADVSKADDVEKLAVATYDRFGSAHVLCNNAGVSTVGQAWEASLADWNFVVSVNLMGVVHGIRSFVPRMIASGEPAYVVNTSSMGGLMPVPMKSPYTAAKHAVVGLTKTLRAELVAAAASVGAAVVCPGAIATGIIDTQLARYQDDENVSPAARKVLDDLKANLDEGMSSDDAAQIVLTGIREDQFWIFPNAEPYFPLVEAEFDGMGLRAGRS